MPFILGLTRRLKRRAIFYGSSGTEAEWHCRQALRYWVRLNPRPLLWHHVLSMPKIHIPTPLRQYTGKQSAVDVKASTIGEALSGLVSSHPDLRRHLYNDEGKLRAFVNVYLN